MRAIFGYESINATSATVESKFNYLKNRTFRDVSLLIRIDKFISKHISCLSGKIKLAMGKLVNDCINYKSETDRNNNNNLLVSIDIPDYDNSPMDNLLVSANITDCDNSSVVNDSTELIEANWRNKNKKNGLFVAILMHVLILMQSVIST